MSVPPATILIVDDEVDLCESMVFIFEDGGYKSYVAYNVKQAMEIVKNHNIDFVVSDIRMPRETGVDLLRQIKAYNPEKPKVILVTGYSDVSEEACLQEGRSYDSQTDSLGRAF